ncbi:MAG TPA: VWA domain-containing protein [Kofleriaceae bacterium]|nr:VWA domain-containing protein [Kofleriaceae bacterium]
MGRLLAVSFALSALVSTAHADAVLSAAHGEDVSEGAYTLTIDLRGLYATVEIRQTFVDADATDAEALYEFDLPSAVVVDRVTVAIPGKHEEVAFGANASSAGAPTPDDDETRDDVPDAALLRIIDHQAGDPAAGTPDLTRYELRVFPIPSKKAVTVRTRFVVPLEVADGRVILRLPARGDAPNLSRETGEVRFHPSGGITGYDHVHVDESDATLSGGRIQFAHGRRGTLVLDATPRARGTDPLVWYDASAIDRARGTVALSYFVPRPASADRLPFDRILFLIDGSRSMEGATDAAATIVDSVLAAAAPSTKVETILFDRSPRALGGWRAIDTAARSEIGKAIRTAELENGTNLPDAMTAAGAALGEDTTAKTLVVVVTDGLVPLDTTGLELAQRLGAPRAGLVASFVLVTPDHAALPDVLHGALADVAYRTGGMVLTARAGEVTTRVKGLVAELGHPAPLHDVSLEGNDTAPDLTLPELLPAGSGGMLIAGYHGAAPTRIALVATRVDRGVKINGVRGTSPELADLALGSIESIALTAHGPDAEPTEDDTNTSEEQLVQTRRRRGLVTDDTSLVAIDSRSRFAAERRKLAQGGGPFMRVSPPGEPRVGPRVPQVRIGTVKLRGDLDARLIHGMIETGLLPRARTCFQPLLLKQRESEGTVRLDLELSRGEVTSAHVAHSDFPADISACVVDAAYKLDVPRTMLDDMPDTVYLVHYPLTFRSLAAGELVLPGDADSSDPVDTGVHADDADQPLGGITPP